MNVARAQRECALRYNQSDRPVIVCARVRVNIDRVSICVGVGCEKKNVA